MALRHLIVAFLLATSAQASITRPKTFAPIAPAPRRAPSSVTLKIRGGAKLVDPHLAGNIFTGLYLASGLAAVFLPYFPNSNGVSEKALSTLEFWGVYELAIGMMAYSVLIHKTSVETAIGVACTTIALHRVKYILSCGPQKFGSSKALMFLAMALSGTSAYGLLTVSVDL
jgi:hypothetical protein